MKYKRTFLINTSYTSWNESPRSRHQVAYELLEYGDVYFITRNEIGLPKVEVKKKAGIKYVIPYWPIDYRFRYRLPFVNEMYQKYLYSVTLNKNLHKSILINFDHTSYRLSKRFDKSVYYCSDDHIGNDDMDIGLVNKYHKYTERKLSENSTYCVATSGYLYDKLKLYNSDTYLIPLGAPEVKGDYTRFFNRNNQKKIKVCYVGYMHDRRISDEIIHNIIKSKDIEFHVVGTVDNKFNKLLKDKAVLSGIKEYEDLYLYLRDMDVGIMPYDLKGVNKGGTPNKYWLYTACGKPSVSVPLENILDWPKENGLLYIANKNQFIETIRRAYWEDSEKQYNYRLVYASKNTWSKRIEQFIAILDKHE